MGWGLGTTNFFKRKFESLRRLRQKRTYAKFDSLISYSELAKQQYAEAGFAKDIFVAHNATVSRRPMPERTFRPEGKFKVINIGRIVEHKNVELLVDAIAKLSAEGLDIGLEIVGDGPHRSALESMTSQTGVDCIFHGMQVGDQLKAIAASCDLFVLPGLGGLAIQEAMSFGLPAIVSEADGTELDLVRDANGWRIPPDDLAALTGAIREAYQNRKQTFDRGLESYRIFNEEINLETMAEKFMHGVTSTFQLQKAAA
jgi:glycosyltransferase involved in cell wall biosynthesis